MNILYQDTEILKRMQRGKFMHELMAELYHFKDSEKYENHKIEASIIQERIESFAKSPYKYLHPDELKFQLEINEPPILRVIYDNVIYMLKNNYKPCEDCINMHEDINGRKFILKSRGYCSFHPELECNADITKPAEILECRKMHWQDYYERSREDLESLANILYYKFHNTGLK